LSPSGWQVRTDFHGWTAYDEIAHLYLFDELAVRAASDAAAFRARQGEIDARLAQGQQISGIARERYAGVSGEALASRWEEAFAELVRHLEPLEPRARLPWFGPDMSARSFATARLMETWAHGQDIYDALGIVRQPTPRLRHIAHLGVVTYQWSYVVRELQPPAEAPLVALQGPAGEIWTWNEQSTSGAVRGPAQDFCLVVTQRRNVDDTSLETVGPVAAQWMRIAQCFAGPPAQGPAPGVRKTAPRRYGV
jgi:uncharacterized protein (TIGR03084 family)